MTLLVGDKARFAVEVGEWRGGQLRRVDMWASDQWLTCEDNTAFVPQLHRSLQAECARMTAIMETPPPFAGLPPDVAHRRLLANDDGLRESWWFLQWGPTTDNVLAHLFPHGDDLAITAEFWREEHLRLHPEHAETIFVAEITADELTGILQDAAVALMT